MGAMHIYIPDKLMEIWKKEFPNRGDASKWVQEELIKRDRKDYDSEAIKEILLNKTQELERLSFEIKELGERLERVKKYEVVKEKQAEEKGKIIAKLDLHNVNAMTKGIMMAYGLKDENTAQSIAIEYLSIDEEVRPVLREYMKTKNKLIYKDI